MLLNLFFVTVKITKRQYSTQDINRFQEMGRTESYLGEMKSKHQVRFL